jgi:hypothetical protein
MAECSILMERNGNMISTGTQSLDVISESVSKVDKKNKKTRIKRIKYN